MTDGQVLTLSGAIIFPLAALMYSNNRISHFKSSLESKMDEVTATLLAEMKGFKIDVDLQMQTSFAQISAEIRELKLLLPITANPPVPPPS